LADLCAAWVVYREEAGAAAAECFVGLAGIKAVAAKEIKVAAAVLADVKRLAAVGIEVADRTERS
jgi:hypothetical protein